MIRLVQRKLIIPRGDTGSFSIQPIAAATTGDAAVFTIFDKLTRTKMFQKSVEVSDGLLTFSFNHNETVNLAPGHYLWDIKFYRNPVFADGELVNGEEIDSYYAAFSLPECEIRQTGDNLLISPMAPSGTLTASQLDIISAALTELAEAVEETRTNVTHYPIILDDFWHLWDATSGEYVNTGIGVGMATGGTTGQILSKKSNTDYDTEWIDQIDISGKADKVSNATEGNFAALDANGNLIDSGRKHSDYVTQETDPTVPSWAKEPNKPTYTPQEIGALPANTFIPEAVSDLENDLGFLREHQDISGKLDVALKGAANGLAELNENGKIPTSQLPSYVDDVIEYSNFSNLPLIGEAGKIYVTTDTNLTYRWSGSEYIAISSSVTLGETSSTAYRGDRGAVAYAHAVESGNEYAEGFYKITTNAEGHVVNARPVVKSDVTALGIPGQNTTYESKTAAEGGTQVSLVTTGEKYTWNNKYDKPENGIPAIDIASGVIPTGTSDLINDAQFTNAGFVDDTLVIDSRGIEPDTANLVEDVTTEIEGYRVTIAQYSSDSEAYAQGTRNGIAVESNDPAYHNNAKYWSDHAFSHTPEGYEALVIDVDDMKVDIKEKVDQLKKEKADMNYIIELYAKAEYHKNAINALDDKIKMKADSTQLAAIAVETDKNSADLRDVNNKIDDIQYDINNVQKDLTNTPRNAEFVALAAEADALNNKITNILTMIKTKAEYNELSALQTVVDSLEKNKVGSSELNNGLARITNETFALAVEVDKSIIESRSSKDAISSVQGSIAEIRDSIAAKIPKPQDNPSSDGKVLIGNEDGSTEWSDPIIPSDEQIEEAVSGWLEEHPEATTTIEDGTVTMEKLSSEVQNAIESNEGISDYAIEMDLTHIMNELNARQTVTENTFRERLNQYCRLWLDGAGVGFIFFSDPHTASAEMDLTQSEFNKLMTTARIVYEGSPARWVLCGGDWLNMHHTLSDAAALCAPLQKKMQSLICPNAYTVVGNHDLNVETPGTGGAFSHEQLNRMWYGTDVGYFVLHSDEADCYMFDSGTQTESANISYQIQQSDWFAEKLLANTSKHLFGAIHIIKVDSNFGNVANRITSIANAFNNRTTITVNSKTYDFSNANGTFHFIVAGHIHSDQETELNNIPVLIIQRALRDGECSMDMCYADFDHAILHAVRIGAGSSRNINIIPTIIS